MSPPPPLFWIGPALLGQPFLRLYLLAEHTGCPLIPDVFANTLTTLTNRVVSRLAWNMPTTPSTTPTRRFHSIAC